LLEGAAAAKKLASSAFAAAAASSKAQVDKSGFLLSGWRVYEMSRLRCHSEFCAGSMYPRAACDRKHAWMARIAEMACKHEYIAPKSN